jgi:hypothetical protein
VYFLAKKGCRRAGENDSSEIRPPKGQRGGTLHCSLLSRSASLVLHPDIAFYAIFGVPKGTDAFRAWQMQKNVQMASKRAFEVLGINIPDDMQNAIEADCGGLAAIIP